MHDIWGLYNLTPQRYLTHERLSHNLYVQRLLVPTGQKKFVAVLRCSRGFYQINSYQVTHLGNNLHRVQNVAGLHFCGTGQTALSKEKKTTTSENKTNKQTNDQNNWKCSYDKWTLQWWSLEEMLCLAHTRKYFWCSGRDKWRDISWSWVTSDLWLHIK